MKNEELRTREIEDIIQHVFLEELYSLPQSERMIFKGGTLLRTCGLENYRFFAELKERFANDVKISEWKLGWESDRRGKLIPEDADFRSAVENIKEILD